jgi:hypothetical protein
VLTEVKFKAFKVLITKRVGALNALGIRQAVVGK